MENMNTHPIGEHTAELKRINKRLDRYEEQASAIIKLTVSVENIAEQIKEMCSDMKEVMEILHQHGNRLERLEDEGFDEQFKEIRTQINSLKESVQEIKDAPGKVVLKYLGIGAGATVSAISLYLLYIFTNGIIGRG